MRAKQKSLGGSFLKFSRNLNSAFLNFFRNRDSYGQQITLNYKGEDSFNTCPGGFLSLILSLFIFSYMVIQFTAMHHHKDWSITQQIIVADPQNIEKLQEFRQMNNISIAVQIQQKREKEVDELELQLQNTKEENEQFLGSMGSGGRGRRLQEKQDNYTMLANNASQYLLVMGMYENKKGNTYEPYDRKINPNSTTWRIYETEVRKNNFGLTEVNLNLSDAVMKGTDDRNNYMEQVTTRLQLRFNSKLAQINSYKSCASDQFISEDEVSCSSQLMSFVEAANTYLDWMVSSSQYTEYGAPDEIIWPYSQSDIEYLLQTKNEDEINLFMYKFYHDIIIMQLGLITWEMAATYHIVLEALYDWQEAYDNEIMDLEDLNNEVTRLSQIIDGIDKTIETAISDSDLTSKVNKVIDKQILVGGTIKTAISEYVTESLDGGEIAIGIKNAIDKSLDGGPIYTGIEDAIDNSLDGGAIYTGIEDYVDTYHSRRRLAVNGDTCSTYLNKITSESFYDEWPSEMINCLENEVEAQGYSQRDIRKMLENERQVLDLHEISTNFLKNYNLFMKDLNDQVFSKLEFEIVIYDEIETFKDSDYKKNNVTYEYPFGVRKNKIDSITFNTLNDVEDYEYKSKNLKFQRSTVCLDPPFYHDIQTLVPKMLGFFTQNILGREEEQEDDIDCDGNLYSKIKYSKDYQSTKTILQDYSKGMIKDKILLEIKLLQDQFETFTERRSTQLFDFFGDIGGVYGIIEVVVAIISSFFSTKLLQGDIANTYFSRKKSKKEMTNEKIGGIDDIKKMFSKIRISTFQMFIDPIFAMFARLDRCKSCSCRRRLSLIDKSQDILSSELDVFSLLNKLGETYNMLKHFQDKQQKTIQKYSKDRAIKLTETDDSSESSSSDQQHDINNQFKEAFKASVLKNVQVKKKDRQAMLVAENKIKEALKASILQRVEMSNFLHVNREVLSPDPNRFDSQTLVPAVDVSQEQLVNRDINFYQDKTDNNNNTSVNYEISVVSDKGRKRGKSKKKKKVQQE